MGTHPIFESDFDCLTETGYKMTKVPPLAEPATIRPILSPEFLGDVSTTSRKNVTPSEDASTGQRRPRGVLPPVPAEPDTSRTLTDDSTTDSVREPRPRLSRRLSNKFLLRLVQTLPLCLK